MEASSLVRRVLFGGLAVLFLAQTWQIVRRGRAANGVASQAAAGDQVAPAFRLPLLRGGDFSLPDTARAGADGAPGGGAQVTLIDFWATWCGPCKKELPNVDAVYRKYRDRGLRVVAVDAEPMQARAQAEKTVAELGIQMPIALAGDEVAGVYGVESLPSVVLVDRAGKMGKLVEGIRSEAELAAVVEAALKP